MDKELLSPQRALEAAGVVVEVPVPVVVTQEIVSDVSAAWWLLKILLLTLPRPLLSQKSLVIGEGPSAIASVPFMMPEMATPTRSPTTEWSCKFNPIFSFQPLSTLILM